MRWGKSIRALAGTIGLALLAGLAAEPAAARIVRLEIVRQEPAFGGRSFGTVGPYVRLAGRAHGEVDPRLPQNAIIQDIRLAPRNARGMVEYVTDIDILRPANLERGNGVLLVEVNNRGRKLLLRNLNNEVAGNQAAVNDLTDAGDGFLMDQGYTLVWFGWQADVAAGEGRLTLTVPVAVNRDGSPVTGLVRAELTTAAPTRTLNLSSGWFTGLSHTSYPTASVDNRTAFPDGFLPSLTVRAREQDPRVALANDTWHFGSCDAAGTVTAGDRQICLPAGFQPGRLYELIYRARDPLVAGLGFAATRDLAEFLKHRDKDTAGTPNPVFRPGQKAVVIGTSQAGRMIRSFIHLGFNRDERGRIAYDGALPHIGGGLLPLNVRFAQPGRAWGEQIDHLYPAYDFPFTYRRQHDPITGRSQGILDRCRRDGTCPRIAHVATALEVWEGRQSLGLTDPMGLRDVADPADVRSYVMASTQHSPAPLPLPTAQPFGVCQQQQNPNPHIWTLRALLTGLTEWVTMNRPPPASAVPRIADGTLVAPNQVTFPTIPANAYGGVQRQAARLLRVTNPLFRLDYGPNYHAADTSGVITREPPGQGTADYAILVPQVDRDGNDLGGLRSVFLAVPIGTYTGWNLGRKDRFEDGFCSLAGSFVPFARTLGERRETGDTRPSIEERYPTRDAYVAAIRAAADKLVAQRYLLPADAALLVRQAEADGIRTGP